VGLLPASLTVKVNPYTLPVGSYSAIITVTAGVSTTITVTLNVTAPPATLGLAPITLAFTAPPITPAAQTVKITTDSQSISFTATSGAKWLTLSLGAAPSAAVTGIVLSPADPVTLTLSVDATGLAPQVAPYVAKITVVASGPPVTTKSQNITVNLTLNSSAPTITSVWPNKLPLNGPAATITVRGTNFYTASVAKIQGVATALVTTVDPKSSTILTAVVPASLQTSAGTLNLIVSNPAPGGDSASAPITVGNTASIYPNGVTSAASYASDAVSPGELVTIFGTNIGPTTAAPLTVTAGYVDTSLSGVGVKIDGKDAPLVYVSQNQLTLQIPYEVATGANKTVAITNGLNSANTTVTIHTAAPGIFTADGSGTGQAAALNLSATTGLYSLNGTASLAKIGDTVILYLTGEGDYNLAPLSGTTNTGYIIPSGPLTQMGTLPTVTIGGVDASAGVTFAGPMVGSMLGLLELAVTVPTGSATGVAVPVVVSIGGNSTLTNQPNVTLAIHP
jgi:uncharacterized protein (TIGR03437 family)